MNPMADIDIRTRRAGFNRALAAMDLEAISQFLVPDALLVTGTDSAILSGRKAQLQAWKREFASRERTIYTRTSESILASPVEPIAHEHGRWEGISSVDGKIVTSGAYTAKWRMIGSVWMIEAELYLTLT